MTDKAAPSDTLTIERLGGLAGFGLSGSALHSSGACAMADLSQADQQAVCALFHRRRGHPHRTPRPDAFRYRLTRHMAGDSQTVDADEDDVPQALKRRLIDRLA